MLVLLEKMPGFTRAAKGQRPADGWTGDAKVHHPEWIVQILTATAAPVTVRLSRLKAS
jgi:hypothetical protein